MKQEKEKVEFRYYEVPKDLPVLALLGEEWEIPYGTDAMHFHNHLEIGYCYYGEGRMHCGETQMEYADKTITIIPKNFPHRTDGKDQCIQKWEYLFIDAEELLQTAYPKRQMWVRDLLKKINSQCLVLQGSDAEELSLQVRLMFEQMRQGREFYQERVRLSALSLLLYIAQLHVQDTALKESSVTGENMSLFLSTIDYVNEHYMEDIGIEELIRIANMSESNYRRRFKEYFNTSPAEYINLVRIDHACKLLTQTDEKIEDIAMRTGFQTAGAFIRNFKKLVGELPKDWRKKVRESETNIGNYNVSVLKGW